jgi:hypothetical protein
MAENISLSRGRTRAYDLDVGATPADTGPFIGEIMNNTDPIRMGRIQVYIDRFGKTDKNDPTGWRTVSYLTPFYGETQHSGTDIGTGTSPGNSHAYGMWFAPPDIGVNVLCFFVNGDPSFGYYIGCVPSTGLNHMIPGIADNTTEINHKNLEVSASNQFYNQEKPRHTSRYATVHQQGLEDDNVRGTITSSVQRETPSNVYGISTPGRPVYSGGYTDANIKSSIAGNEQTTTADIKVIGRRGGHSIVMDDGDLEGNNQMVRIRTEKGHQIVMSDDGDSFYITHANGQSWVELGKEGTVDVYSSNSVNVRTEGSINMHADDDINMYAGRNVNIKGNQTVTIETPGALGLKSDGTIALVSGGQTTIKSGGNFAAVAPRIDLNDASTLSVAPIPVSTFDDVKYDGTWQPDPGKISSITTRAPTHEPYNSHNSGVATVSQFPREQLNTDIITLIGNAKVDPPSY